MLAPWEDTTGSVPVVYLKSLATTNMIHIDAARSGLTRGVIVLTTAQHMDSAEVYPAYRMPSLEYQGTSFMLGSNERDHT